MPVLPSAILDTAVVAAYGLMVGFGVSAKRAVAMFLVALGVKACGRTYDFLSAWMLSFLLILWQEWNFYILVFKSFILTVKS